MENLSTDNIMRLQVEQLEKEKRELNEKMRIVSKRLDHIERAYRKEERPLLAKDYERQQAEDRIAHEAAQKTRLEAARTTHQHDLETKKRLSRMLDVYKVHREVLISKRSEEFAKRKETALKKIEQEKAKRREAVLQEREEERQRVEEEERLRREQEEEERRREDGKQYLFDFWSIVLLMVLYQNSARRKSVAHGKKRRLLQPRRRRRERRKRKLPPSASNARKNVKRLWSKHVFNASARKKQKPVVLPVPQNAKPKNNKQLDQMVSVAQPKAAMPGDVVPPGIQYLRLRFALPLPCPLLGQKAPLLHPGSAVVELRVAV